MRYTRGKPVFHRVCSHHLLTWSILQSGGRLLHSVRLSLASSFSLWQGQFPLLLSGALLWILLPVTCCSLSFWQWSRGSCVFPDRLAAEFLSVERQLSVNPVPDSDSMESLVRSVSHQCSSLQSVAVWLLLIPCWPVCCSHFVLSLCNCPCTGNHTSQLSEGETCRIALGCLA